MTKQKCRSLSFYDGEKLGKAESTIDGRSSRIPNAGTMEEKGR